MPQNRQKFAVRYSRRTTRPCSWRSSILATTSESLIPTEQRGGQISTKGCRRALQLWWSLRTTATSSVVNPSPRNMRRTSLMLPPFWSGGRGLGFSKASGGSCSPSKSIFDKEFFDIDSVFYLQCYSGSIPLSPPRFCRLSLASIQPALQS